MNKRSKKYLLTINNPKQPLKETVDLLMKLSPDYVCASAETGSEGTPHYHIYLHRSTSAMNFDRVKSICPTAHIDYCHGTSPENRDYVFKIGKHEGTEKEHTNDKTSHIEIGTCPDEQPGKRNDFSRSMEMIQDGYRNLEILDEIPNMLDKMAWLDKYRQEWLMETVGKRNRDDLQVIYVCGKTGTGKTSSVYKKHGYDDVYRVNCDHRNPFDNYQGQDVLLLDEFNSSIKIQDLLQMLDKYPYQFDSRYTNKWLCATTIYIVSNKHIYEQYPNIQKENPEIWKAFIRRIHRAYIQTGFDTQVQVELKP